MKNKEKENEELYEYVKISLENDIRTLNLIDLIVDKIFNRLHLLTILLILSVILTIILFIIK